MASSKNRVLLLATIAALGVLAPRAARAQDAGNSALDTFHFAMDSRGYLTVNASQVLGHKEFSFGIVTDWGRKLLEFESGPNTMTVENIVTPTFVFAIGFKLGPAEIELGASAPFGIMSGSRDPDDDNGTITPNDDRNFDLSGQGVGNLGIHLKSRFLKTTRGAKIGLAAIVGAYLPTVSQKDRFLGSDGVSPQAILVVDKEFGKDRRLRLAVNAGVRLHTGTTSYTDNGNGDMGSPATGQTIDTGAMEIPIGAGIAWAITPQKFDVVGEITGAIPLDGENYFPLEAIAGIKVYLGKNSFLSLGGGWGLMPKEGANPDGRAFIAIILEPNLGDRDGDGIKDDVDDCPDEPEDEDEFQDEDGCPEDDNDRDGIKDWDDACPLNPEDKDQFEDEDGCPEGNKNDRDGDGLLDDVDECPDDPEDFDEFKDEDGCPEPDNDKDRINDEDDRCPNPETEEDPLEDSQENYNGNEDDDGCPDKGRVTVTDTNIEILDKVYFALDSDVILEKSFPILDAVAATMEGNPDIGLIEIQGHTDQQGNDEYNLKLSDRRAASVKRYLVDKGISEDRLTSQGYGEQVLIDKKKNEKAYAKNRRVEFLILKRGGG